MRAMRRTLTADPPTHTPDPMPPSKAHNGAFLSDFMILRILYGSPEAQFERNQWLCMQIARGAYITPGELCHNTFIPGNILE